MPPCSPINLCAMFYEQNWFSSEHQCSRTREKTCSLQEPNKKREAVWRLEPCFECLWEIVLQRSLLNGLRQLGHGSEPLTFLAAVVSPPKKNEAQVEKATRTHLKDHQQHALAPCPTRPRIASERRTTITHPPHQRWHSHVVFACAFMEQT